MEEWGKLQRPLSPSMKPAESVRSAAAAVTAEEEEENIEKFYALIGKIKAARDLSKNSVRSKRERRERLVWKPTFEWEDFASGMSDGVYSVPLRGGDSRKRSRKELEETGEAESSVNLSMSISLDEVNQ